MYNKYSAFDRKKEKKSYTSVIRHADLMAKNLGIWNEKFYTNPHSENNNNNKM